jgi:hypothetical protein
MRTISGFFNTSVSFACIIFVLFTRAEVSCAAVRATARYAPWKICIDEATIVRFVTNSGLLLAADLLGEVTVGDAWNSYDDEGPSFKMLFKFMAGCAGMSVLFDRLLNSCPECPHCAQGLLTPSLDDTLTTVSGLPESSFADSQSAFVPGPISSFISHDSLIQDGPEDITPIHTAACLFYNLGKLISVFRLGRTIHYVLTEDKDFGEKCVVIPAAVIGMTVLLKDLRASYQEYKKY